MPMINNYNYATYANTYANQIYRNPLQQQTQQQQSQLSPSQQQQQHASSFNGNSNTYGLNRAGSNYDTASSFNPYQSNQYINSNSSLRTNIYTPPTVSQQQQQQQQQTSSTSPLLHQITSTPNNNSSNAQASNVSNTATTAAAYTNLYQNFLTSTAAVAAVSNSYSPMTSHLNQHHSMTSTDLFGNALNVPNFNDFSSNNTSNNAASNATALANNIGGQANSNGANDYFFNSYYANGFNNLAAAVAATAYSSNQAANNY